MWSSWQGVFFSSSRPPLPFPCASLVVFSFDGFCLRSNISAFGFPAFLPSLSLLRLFTLTCFSTLVLRTFPRILVSFLGWLVIFLLGLFFLSSLGFGLVWFSFTFFITRSNLSSFATGSSLWAKLSRMVVSWGSSGLSHLLSWVVRPLPVLANGSLILFIITFGVAFFLQLRFAPLGFLTFSLFMGLSSFPYGLTFFLLVLCCHLSPFRVSPHSLFSYFSGHILSYCAVAVYFNLFFLVYIFVFYSWRRAPGKFPSPPIVLRLDLSWPSSVAIPGFVASSSIGPLCPWG